MKESLNYYYNLNLLEVENFDSIYRFKYQNQEYYFVPLKRLDNELEDIVNVSRELKQRGYPVHDLINNRFAKLITNVFNQNYILLRPLSDTNREIDLSDIIKMNRNLTLTPAKSALYRNSWASLWSAKVDYFEYQIRELGQNKKIILNSFSYYIGLAENAICYVNSTHAKYKPSANDKICLSHRRLNYPNYQLNYFNPLSFIFDLEVRDLASYIKSAFINKAPALDYLKTVLRLKPYSIYSLQLFYARLLYPTYYFDIYEKIMNNESEEEELIPIIELASDYEIFLDEAYQEITKYAKIEPIEWLNNKKL